MPADSIDAVVTDAPYGLSFMGKAWDYDVPKAEVWREVIRVLKPGGHLLSFFGTRTYHRGVVQIEDAGFEIRDAVVWMYGQGFPKSLDVSKAIDSAAGVERETSPVVAMQRKGDVGEISRNVRCAICGKARASGNPCVCPRLENIPATEAAKQWQGWGTALKPAHEPIVLARKPLIGTVAANVLAHGTGGLNVDGCRIGTEEIRAKDSERAAFSGFGTFHEKGGGARSTGSGANHTAGRWPPNVCLDETAAAMLDEMSGDCRSAGDYPSASQTRNGVTSFCGEQGLLYTDSGGASRFFYVAKASRSERGQGNLHPTVKPVSLMRWLVRLVTPPGGTVLDPFAGSGTTGVAALQEGFGFIGMEREAEYAEIARRRLAKAMGEDEPQLPLFKGQHFTPKPPRPVQLTFGLERSW